MLPRTESTVSISPSHGFLIMATASSKPPRHKRLAVEDGRGNRASSTPPVKVSNGSLLVLPTLGPSSRHSSPGIERLLNGRLHVEELIPRRLTVSPAVRIRDRDRTRKRLTQYHSIDHAAELLRSAKNIVVLSGAGISTSLNIPDFRSHTGKQLRCTPRDLSSGDCSDSL